jgi:uncharacterized protein YjbJ (UPF0337 family)
MVPGPAEVAGLAIFVSMAIQRGNPWCHTSVSQSSSTRRAGRFSGVRHQEKVMNKDQIKGRVKEAEGKIKEVAGKLVGNETLEAKGKVQKILGEAQAKFGDVKQDVKDAKKGA